MKSDPNVVTRTNQLDIGTSTATAPIAARNTNPDAIATRSTTAMCFQIALYVRVISM